MDHVPPSIWVSETAEASFFIRILDRARFPDFLSGIIELSFFRACEKDGYTRFLAYVDHLNTYGSRARIVAEILAQF